MEIEQGDILICTVDNIQGTTVFVKIEGTSKTGTIIMSEVSAGRIRNLRDYVVPKKVIVCKVLRELPDHIELSLRRVTQKEKKEAMEQKKLEQSYTSILKSVLKEKTPEFIEKINETEKLYDFLEESKENPKKLEKVVGKENSEKILEILKSQKQKTVSLKRQINFSSQEKDGLRLIKETLGKITGAEIKYLAAGKYSVQAEAQNIKEADQKIGKILEEIKEKSKGKNIQFQ